MVSLPATEVNVKCSQCGTVQTFNLNPIKLEMWIGGESIQDVFPELSANDRETLISARSNATRNTPIICGDCFDRMFGPED